MVNDWRNLGSGVDSTSWSFDTDEERERDDGGDVEMERRVMSSKKQNEVQVRSGGGIFMIWPLAVQEVNNLARTTKVEGGRLQWI